MTNQSSALREPEREQDHLRPPHLTPKSDILEATAATNSKRLKTERCSPSPTRLQSQLHQQRDHQQHREQRERERGDRERERERDRERERERDRDRDQQLSREPLPPHQQQAHQPLPPSPPTPLALYPRKVNRDYNSEPGMNDDHHHLPPPHSASVAMQDERARTPDDEDDDEDDPMHNDIGMHRILFHFFNFYIKRETETKIIIIFCFQV